MAVEQNNKRLIVLVGHAHHLADKCVQTRPYTLSRGFCHFHRPGSGPGNVLCCESEEQAVVRGGTLEGVCRWSD